MRVSCDPKAEELSPNFDMKIKYSNQMAARRSLGEGSKCRGNEG